MSVSDNGHRDIPLYAQTPSYLSKIYRLSCIIIACCTIIRGSHKFSFQKLTHVR